MEFGANPKDVQGTKLPKATAVKNKAPSNRQITVEHILREAKELQIEGEGVKAPRQIITDPEELGEDRLSKRKKFKYFLTHRHNSWEWGGSYLCHYWMQCIGVSVLKDISALSPTQLMGMGRGLLGLLLNVLKSVY
jgi:hypothetical protein